MKNENKILITALLISVVLASCVPAATAIPTEAVIPASTFTSVPIQTSITSTSTTVPIIQTAHCRVTNDGLETSYALAWANVCEVCYEGYREIYGLDALALNNLAFVDVRLFRDPRLTPSLDAYGGKMTFRGNEAHLRPPADGGANNIYGICHEMGHLVFPIADSYYFEAWADYAAAYRIIPYIWERLGADAWPQPYDYLVNDGPVDLRQRIEDGTENADIYYQAVATLIAVDETYDPQVIGQAILQMKAPLKLSGFEEALVEVTGDQTVRELFAKGP